MLMLNSMSPTAYSGLVAGIISGCVSLIGYIATTVVQKKAADKTVEAQKEIAQMQKEEKLIYETQISWANDTRKLIAKLVSDCLNFNIIVMNINSIGDQLNDPKISVAQKRDLVEESTDELKKSAVLFPKIKEELVLIKLYLFHKDDEDEQRLLKKLESLENNMDSKKGIDENLLNYFVEVARSYFDKQMKKIK